MHTDYSNYRYLELFFVDKFWWLELPIYCANFIDSYWYLELPISRTYLLIPSSLCKISKIDMNKLPAEWNQMLNENIFCLYIRPRKLLEVFLFFKNVLDNLKVLLNMEHIVKMRKGFEISCCYFTLSFHVAILKPRVKVQYIRRTFL